MVTLYYWEPTTPAEVLRLGIMPDLGHASLEVSGSPDAPDAYISFWPEADSVIGAITDLFKRRQARFPASYAEESDPEGSYLQRPADAVEHMEGLDEARIVRLWALMRAHDYDFLRWNCSNVCRFLLTAAMTRGQYARAAAAAECTWDELVEAARGESGDDLPGLARTLATAAWLDCRPDDVLRIARALSDPAPHDAIPVSLVSPCP